MAEAQQRLDDSTAAGTSAGMAQGITSSASSRTPRPKTARDQTESSAAAGLTISEDHRRSFAESTDEKISILDPRRFTPTLHANLVSEILTLRRELDSKHKIIEDLEVQLHTSKDENEDLTKRLSHSNKESRSAKRQIQQLEHGTLVALEELAKDRNDKAQACDELKTKVDKLEKKVKSQDEDAARSHVLWERDRESFETQKRALERRAHVSDARLKTLLSELAEQQVTRDTRQSAESEDEETRDSGLGNDSDTNSIHSSATKTTPSRKATHARNMSSISQRSLHRVYRSSTPADAGSVLNGPSLADELGLNDEEEEDDLEAIDEDDEETFLEHGFIGSRGQSRKKALDTERKAKRILGLAQGEPLPTNLDTFASGSQAASSWEPALPLAGTKQATNAPSRYVDSGIQYSRPGSPIFNSTEGQYRSSLDDASTEVGECPRVQTTDGTPQSRVQSMVWSINSRSQSVVSTFDSRGETPMPQDADAVTICQAERPTMVMVSAGMQTVEQSLSPSESVAESSPAMVLAEQAIATKQHETRAASTQTDILESPSRLTVSRGSFDRSNKPGLIAIPSITIVPPTSTPNSPKETILPPGTKNISTQTVIEDLVTVRSISMQTDEIRVDQRLRKIAPHLLPSALDAIRNPASTSQVVRKSDSQKSLGTRETNNLLREANTASKQAAVKTTAKAPNSNVATSSPTKTRTSLATRELAGSKSETDPTRKPGATDIRAKEAMSSKELKKAFRTSSFFTTFDSDEEVGKRSETEAERRSAPQKQSSVPNATELKRNRRDGRPGRGYGKPPTPISEEKEITARESIDSLRQRPQIVRYQSRSSFESARVTKKPPSMRRSALAKGSDSTKPSRSRSPSLRSTGSSVVKALQSTSAADPPYPIPNRLSSRKVLPTGAKSDGASSSPTPRATGLSYFARRNSRSQHLARNDSIRKVKSAAIMPRRSGEDIRAGSPPAPTRTSGPPPMPEDAVTRPQYAYATQASSSVAQTPVTATDNVSDSGQPTVIDAIAATMVGEWMWKYVRRRKSFSVTESPDDFSRNGREGAGGVRHKRWVWISPYERSVMWSTKQPASGSALLGKSGRKLLIQSVLDVKDDTPPPRGSNIQPSFNRSILVLTPARALKFTAISQERHYLWLTALSFLAQSGVGAPELAAIPPLLNAEPEPSPPNTSFSRRANIRDSVLLGREKKKASALSSLTSSRDSSSKKGPSLLSPTILAEVPISDAADAPTIPRYTYNVHSRKRSNTGPRIPPPPSALRNYTSPTLPMLTNYNLSSTSSHTYVHNAETDNHTHYISAFGNGISQPASLYGSNSTAVSGYVSEAPTSGARTPRSAQFEDVGTMRMDAFVAPRRPSVDVGNAISAGPATGSLGVAAAGSRAKQTAPPVPSVGASGMPSTGTTASTTRARGQTHWSGRPGAVPSKAPMLITGEFESFDPFKGF